MITVILIITLIFGILAVGRVPGVNWAGLGVISLAIVHLIGAV